jgi:hypothetical protein
MFVRGFFARDRESSESCAVEILLGAVSDIKCVDAVDTSRRSFREPRVCVR